MELIDYWRENNDYHARIGEEDRLGMWRRIHDWGDVEEVLEVGAGRGNNLAALARCGVRSLTAVEPNAKARSALKAKNIGAFDMDARKLDFEGNSFDLVFCSGLLIHIHPDDHVRVMREMQRVSKRYLVFIEYFSARFTEQEYRGSYIYKRDWGQLFEENFRRAWTFKKCGFEWKGATGLDNLTWWLFEKG